MDELTLFCEILNSVVDLKYRPKVKQYKRKVLKLGRHKIEGLYTGTPGRGGKLRHDITICAGITGEHLFAVLAHEYCHAVQMERDPKQELGHTADEDIYFKIMRYWFIMEFDIDVEGWY